MPRGNSTLFIDGLPHGRPPFRGARFDSAFAALEVLRQTEGNRITRFSALPRSYRDRVCAKPESAFYQCVLEATGNPVLVFECSAGLQTLLYVNPAFERWSGHSAMEVLGCDWRSVAGVVSDESDLEQMQNGIKAGHATRALLRNRRLDGGSSWNEIHLAPLPTTVGARSRYVGVLRDVTAERNDREELRYRAFHDPLTGLPNRQLLRDRLDHAIGHARSRGVRFAVAFLDVDRFKQINDTFGHQAGDRLLQQLAEALQRGVRGGDTVARIGGDEFVLLLTDIQGEETAERIAHRVLNWLSQSIDIGGTSIPISCSVGIAKFPDHGADGAQLLSHADCEMYRHKRRTDLP